MIGMTNAKRTRVAGQCSDCKSPATHIWHDDMLGDLQFCTRHTNECKKFDRENPDEAAIGHWSKV